jgi:hypothetical protein
MSEMGHQCPRCRNVTSDVVALNLPFPEAVRTGSNSPKGDIRNLVKGGWRAGPYFSMNSPSMAIRTPSATAVVATPKSERLIVPVAEKPTRHNDPRWRLPT